MFETNENIARLPKHLLQYVKNQPYEKYSPIDQAVWRYVMRQNIDFLPKVAHESYLDGLDLAGISIDEIPSMYGMNRILQKIGWAAVAVDGLIPSSAFLEFQAYKVLVIAQDIRQLAHISYTPAPDIIHESAGHAPIISNPEYAEYLRRLGEIGCRAIPSAHDGILFEAVRKLSILKEQFGVAQDAIDNAQAEVDRLQSINSMPSELSRLKNLHWWTVEYGLIGSIENPKIYGAGLLSSIGESKSCLQPDVKKLPYDIGAADYDFDVTRPQPQLFVTPDFSHLSFVLEQFANSMAIRTGGAKGIQQLIDSQSIGSCMFNTGIQISGVFSTLITNQNGQPIYVGTKGPSALSYRDKELIGHGKSSHPNGYGTPLGRLENTNTAIENMSPYDLAAYKIMEGQHITFNFEGGLKVAGTIITGMRTVQGTIIIISLRECLVTYQNQVLFTPQDGIYHMAIGSSIVSAYAGYADHSSFELETSDDKEASMVIEKPKELLDLENLYGEVRKMRNNVSIDITRLEAIQTILNNSYPDDWLLGLEIRELIGEK